MSGYFGLVAICVTQPLWPKRVPRLWSVSVIFTLLQLNWKFFHWITSVHCNERKEKECHCVVLHESGVPNETAQVVSDAYEKRNNCCHTKRWRHFWIGRTVFSSESKSSGNIFSLMCYYLSRIVRSEKKVEIFKKVISSFENFVLFEIYIFLYFVTSTISISFLRAPSSMIHFVSC